MGRKTSTAEKEVDRIRLQIYEEIKDMTIEELGEYYRKGAEEMAKKYGFRLVSTTGEV